ncbi:ScpA family protein [soil metagenome]
MQTTVPEIDLSSIALVEGQPYLNLPKDLYIPPDALRVFLETFEGPLDLLLYLIKRQNLDILNIPIAEITRQYMQYVEMMHKIHLELAAEYLLMAAMLAEIKSRLLLPRPVSSEDNDEHDPRAELIRRLQEYERFKTAAQNIDALPRQGRDVFVAQAEPPEVTMQRPQPIVNLQELVAAFKDVLLRTQQFENHQVKREHLSVRERMSQILSRVVENHYIEFHSLFTPEEGRLGVVVSFLALLELLKQSLVEMVQHAPFTVIHITKGKEVSRELEEK